MVLAKREYAFHNATTTTSTTERLLNQIKLRTKTVAKFSPSLENLDYFPISYLLL